MAKTQKYSEEQLLEAVVKFSEIEKKKIKATALANWSRNNIEGLEEVRDYHFTRPIKEKNKKTGKIIERPKLCSLKIMEINKSRSLIVSVNTNLLLRASNIDNFMELSDVAKRKMIVETRETVDKLLANNGNLARQNEALQSENKSLKSDILSINDKIISLKKAQDKLARQVTYLMKQTDETNLKKVLSQMGIEDGSVDLNTYNDSLQQELSEIMHITKTLKRYISEEHDSHITDKKKPELTNDIISGLDF